MELLKREGDSLKREGVRDIEKGRDAQVKGLEKPLTESLPKDFGVHQRVHGELCLCAFL